MQNVAVIGAGKIGATAAGLLASAGYKVTLADRSPAVLDRVERHERIRCVPLNVENSPSLLGLLNDQSAVINAAPFHLTLRVAEAARAARTHYLDLTEDVSSTRRVKELAADAGTAFIPQCGLAPGFVSVAAFDLAKRFEVLDSVRLRVGALPQFPSNALNYNLTWSTDGVINEYCEPCEAIVNGVRREVAPLEGLEEFSLDGVTYEAFNTSGGLGTLCDTLEGKVRTLDYRTIRYPGHAAIMRALLNDLRLRDRRDVLKDILENAVPTTLQDVVIIFVTVSGRNGGSLMQETYANKIYSRDVEGKTLTAIQITTAAAICTMFDLLATWPNRAARVYSSRGRAVAGVSGQSIRPSLRQAGQDCSVSTVRRGRAMMKVPLVQLASVRKDALDILARLGVRETAFAHTGLAARSPISGELIAHLAETSQEQASAAIGRAAQAFAVWREVPAPRRGEFVRLLGEELRSAKADLGRLVTLETGKIASEGLGEVQEMIDICDFAVGLSRQLYGRTIATERAEHRMMETWHPLGVCGVISAFNFPVAVWSWNAALALVCGDPVVWKPSEKTPLTALAVQAIVQRAMERFGDAPAGLSEVLIGGRDVGEMLVDDPRVAVVSATGSTTWAAPSALASPRGLPAPSWSSAATTPRSSRRRPISTWRCGPSPSLPWALQDSAAPRCGACSSRTRSTSSFYRGCRKSTPPFRSAIRALRAPWSAR